MRDIIRFFRQTYRAVRTDGDADADLESPALAASETGTDCQKTTTTVTHSEASAKFRRTSIHQAHHHRPATKVLSILDVFFQQPKRSRGPRWPKGVFLLKATGLLAIISAILLYIAQPYTAIFRWKLIFSEGGEIFTLWQNPPVEVFIKIYLYNITNANEFMSGAEQKLNVSQVGPYVYREKSVHDHVEFNGNGTLSTVPKHPLIWDEELSMGLKEQDMLWLPNIALLSIAQVTARKSFFFRTPINMLIRQTHSEPIIRMTAREFMFGYASTLTTLGNQLMPDWIYFDKVGLIDRMYDFDGDHETVFTGETDSSISGLIDTYRGSRNLAHWKGSHCSDIHRSSDGTKFKSFLQPNETLLFYRKNLCRAQRMERTSDELVKVGNLYAHRYEFEKNALDNGKFDQRNRCFCRTEDTCLPAGLIDVSDCYYGFPIALSYPHLLEADESIVDDVVGNRPNRSEHGSYMLIQPMTGMPVKVSVKIQINLAMHDVSNMAHVERFSNIVLPMLWFETTMPELPPSLKSRFYLYLNILPVVDAIGQLLLFATGVTLVLVAIVRAALQFSRSMQISGQPQQPHKFAHFGGKDGGADQSAGGVLLTGPVDAGYDYDVDDDEDDDGFDGVSYELSEKCIGRSGEDVVLYEVNLCMEQETIGATVEESAYMLEQEQAISEDDDDDDGGEGGRGLSGSESDDRRSMSYEDSSTVVGLPSLCNENSAFDRGDLIERTGRDCRLGMFTSSLEDIATDAFPDVKLLIDGAVGGGGGGGAAELDSRSSSDDSSTGSARKLVT